MCSLRANAPVTCTTKNRTVRSPGARVKVIPSFEEVEVQIRCREGLNGEDAGEQEVAGGQERGRVEKWVEGME
jgi:hypothetical protein